MLQMLRQVCAAEDQKMIGSFIHLLIMQFLESIDKNKLQTRLL